MRLTQEQKLKVEANMGLVGKVIADKVHGTNQYRIYSYEDLYQIGCIGLCKAAATDKGGCFSTYAYRMIWNEICDALIYVNLRANRELLTGWDNECTQISEPYKEPDEHQGIEMILSQIKSEVCPTVQKGIEALVLKVQGYSGKEIGDRYGVSERLVAAWISKARKYLKSCPQLQHEI